jgi:putative transposase
MERRKFSREEKLKILKEARENGVKSTLSKHGLYQATYYYWKKKYDSMGEEGLQHSMTKERLQEIRRLEKENASLKEIMAEKDLVIKMQQELIKKKYR